MPDYFDGFPVAGWLRHFTVTYSNESDLDAAARANAIVASCEGDLIQLQEWFNCNYDDSPYAIWVHVGAGVVGGGASNDGYEDGDESSRIYVGGTYQPGSADPAANAIRDDLARMLFVAELAEILMDFTGRGWNRGDSAGEALSRVAAAVLHPLGYYGSGDGPTIDVWLKSPRIDYVSGSEGTDQNGASYGCGILFLNYLAHQLNYSFPQIVQAGGSNLADTYSRLTSQPAANAFGPFEALIQKHIKYPAVFTSFSDNIFPLYDNPGLGFLVNAQSFPSTKEVGPPHHVTLKAGLICPPEDYTYDIEDVPVQMTVKAITTGFAHADFDWTLGGVPLPFHGLSEGLNVNVHITDTTPGKDAAFMTSLPIRYLIEDGNDNTSTLQFWNKAFPGNGDVDISVVASESQEKSIQATLTDNWPLNMRTFDMDSRWNTDVKACNPRFLEISSVLAKLGHRIFLLKNTPDPPPDQLSALAREAEQYLTLLKEITGDSVGMQKAVLAEARGQVQFSGVNVPPAIEAPGVSGGRPLRVVHRLPARKPQESSGPNRSQA
jgi:hypothetical protein